MKQVMRLWNTMSLKQKIAKLELSNGEIELRSYRIYSDYYNNSEIDNYVFGIYLVNINQLIGFCDLRIGDHDALLYLGHIGYSIFANYRGYSYAYHATKLLLKVADALDYNFLTITVNPENIPSIKTIEKLKVTFIHELRVPTSESLYEQGDRYKRIYHVNVKENL